MSLVAAACVVVASRQGQGERASQVPTDQQLESVTGLQVSFTFYTIALIMQNTYTEMCTLL